MAKHAPDVMSPQFFAEKVKLHKKKGKFTLKGRTVHPLKEIHNDLTAYSNLHKAQLQARHQLLDQIVRKANNYIRGKDPTKTHSEKVQTVAILAWQCNQRLTIEKQRAKAFGQQLTQHHHRGAHIHGGLHFERVAKPGQLNVTGGDLAHHAQQGTFGVTVPLTGNDEVGPRRVDQAGEGLRRIPRQHAPLDALGVADPDGRARHDSVSRDDGRLLRSRSRCVLLCGGNHDAVATVDDRAGDRERGVAARRGDRAACGSEDPRASRLFHSLRR